MHEHKKKKIHVCCNLVYVLDRYTLPQNCFLILLQCVTNEIHSIFHCVQAKPTCTDSAIVIQQSNITGNRKIKKKKKNVRKKNQTKILHSVTYRNVDHFISMD